MIQRFKPYQYRRITKLFTIIPSGVIKPVGGQFDKFIEGCENHVNKNNKRRRRRRSTKEDIIYIPIDDADDEEEILYDPAQVNITKLPQFPTKSGITKEQATDECIEALVKSTFAKACLQLYPEMNSTSYIEDCVTDIKLSEDIATSKQTAVASFTIQCQHVVVEEFIKKQIIAKNNTQEETNITSDGISTYTKPPPTSRVPLVFVPPAILVENLCPNGCSGNGEWLPPTITGIAGKGLCDIRKRECTRTRLNGINSVDTDQLLSKSRRIDISEVGYRELDVEEGQINEVVLLTMTQLIVELPLHNVNIFGDVYGEPGQPTGGFTIAMSNDGVNFSKNKSLFIVFDGKCMACNPANDKICQQKENTCLVNGYCFTAKEVDPKNWCQICEPTSNQFTERTTEDNASPVSQNISNELNAIKGQLNEYLIEAKDPESKPISFETVGSHEGVSLTTDGLLSFRPTTVGASRIIIPARNICGASTDQDFILRSVKCPCEGYNRASCVWKDKTQGSMECVCPKECTGEK
ncbi:von Willebrand factor D and EGF domain-containing protein-like [Clytia hemisphaerica]|uniref:von Willebrand factor D and EGF domain-containing protein-like n=1 Tax=Clytia hemisphaerica TaxID=252671 RepID=UPI0034D6465B